MKFASFLQKPKALAFIVALGLCSTAVSAGELRLRAQLAWGTDDAKPSGQNLKEMDPKLREKFRHLRWKNYFIVKSELNSIPTKTTKHVVFNGPRGRQCEDHGLQPSAGFATIGSEVRKLTH